MKHKWSKNTVTNISICLRCGLTVKTYRTKRGGLPPCNPETTTFPEAICRKQGIKPPLACFNCVARTSQLLCDALRKCG